VTFLRAAVRGSDEQRGHVMGEGSDLELFNAWNSSVGGGVKGPLTITAVYAAVRIIAETVAMIPLEIRRRDRNGVVEVDDRSPLVPLLTQSPNPELDAGAVWEFIVASLLLRGEGYLWRQRTADGRVRALWPVRPDAVQVVRAAKPDATGIRRRLYLINSSSDEALDIAGTEQDVLHIRGMGFDGTNAWNPMQLLRGLLDEAKQEADYNRNLLKNGARPSGVLKVKGTLSDDAAKRLRERWRKAHSGGKSGGTAVLEDDADWSPIQMSAADAQMLEQRQFTRQEVAMAFRIPAHMLLAGQGSGLRYSSASMDMQAFAQLTIAPWCSRIERALRHDAELPWTFGANGGRLFPRFDLDRLSEADPTNRYQNWLLARRGGWITANEIRRHEGRGEIEGGDELMPVTGTETDATEPK
jgi:HK97 family phage portal protein